MIFADKLIQLRKKNGLSQEELADKEVFLDKQFPNGKVLNQYLILIR